MNYALNPKAHNFHSVIVHIWTENRYLDNLGFKYNGLIRIQTLMEALRLIRTLRTFQM